MSRKDVSDYEGKCESEVVCKQREAIVCLAQSPSGHWLALASYDHTVCLCKPMPEGPTLPTYRVVARIELECPLKSVVFDPTGHWLVITTEHQTAHAYRINCSQFTPQEQIAITRHRSIQGTVFSPDARWLAVYGTIPGVSAWYLSTVEEPRHIFSFSGQHRPLIDTLAVSPNSRWMAAGASDGTVRVWNLADLANRLQQQEDAAQAVHLLNDGHLLNAQLEAVFALAFSPDGKWLVASGIGTHVCAWTLQGSPAEWKHCTLQGHEEEVVPTFCISPNSQWLATAGFDGTARLWNLRSEDVNASCRVLRGHKDRLMRILITPDCRWIVTTSVDQTVRMWSLSTRPLDISSVLLDGPPRGASHINVSQNSRWLLAASGGLDWNEIDTNAFVWDLSSRIPQESRMALVGHKSSIVQTAFVLDDQAVVTASCDGTARLWRLPAAAVSHP